MSIVWIILVAIILFFSFLHLRESIKISEQNRERCRREREWANKRREDEEKLKRETDKRWERAVREQQEREMRKSGELKERTRKEQVLVKQFVKSDEVRKMVTYICGGDLSNRPIEIWVWSFQIDAGSHLPERVERRYDLREHRVTPLKAVSEEKDGFDSPREVYAMALAINSILNNDYDVRESGIISELKLKPNKSF